jgi:hypothetical protein
MVTQKQRLKAINTIIADKIIGKRLKLVKALYQESYIDEEDFNKPKYFVFQNVETEKLFSIRESILTNYCFRFKKELIYVVANYGKGLLVANSEMVLYRQGERKVFAYIYATDETIRLDNMFRDDVLKITRSGKTNNKTHLQENK